MLLTRSMRARGTPCGLRLLARLGGASLATVTLASVAMACGGSTRVVTAPTTTAPTTASRTAFTACLVKQGIPAQAAATLGGRRAGAGGGGPNGTGGGGPGAGGEGGGFTAPSLPAGVTQAQYRAALQSCRSLLPGRGAGGRSGFNSAAGAAYRNCLQIHGVTVPTPGSRTSTTTAPGSPTSTPGGGRGFGGLDTSNPTVRSAMAACAVLLPGRVATTTSSTTAVKS